MKGRFQPLRWLTQLSHYLPGRCLLCDCPFDDGAALFCSACLDDLPVNDCACYQCALPLATPGYCAACLDQPPSFDKTVAPFRYQAPLATLINRWKHQGDSRPLNTLIDSLRNQLLQEYQQTDWPDLLLPVPLPWRRRLVRGFNQTEQMSKLLSRHLNIPSNHQLLRAKGGEHSQQGLNRKQRLGNLAGRFTLREKVTAEHVALVDDVMTTGATASYLAKLLQDAGVKRVDVWLIARTP
ncbi:ComF family protein [Simiduia curdlanivorans]|uniref:ComF family protein n=1 Tax=Simiduia curdlanivorans TaxID=1492769 RepID=A0ABV8V2A2_9GAMM|nr:ComF family protein [Simiduia curdlanivorans]MDN3637626.1 ComF family protein [Simiduia curdlanivorans]